MSRLTPFVLSVSLNTQVAAKVAGPNVPPGRIFGSGTCLDSSRLRSLVAHALGIDAQSTHGYVVGEHGDSQVCVWSSVRVGGVPLLKYGEEPGEAHESVHKEILMSGSEVIKRKGKGRSKDDALSIVVSVTKYWHLSSHLQDTPTGKFFIRVDFKFQNEDASYIFPQFLIVTLGDIDR